MPIFDYSCDNCGGVKLDELVRNPDEVISCEDCGEVMTKGIGAPALLGFDSNGTSKSVSRS